MGAGEEGVAFVGEEVAGGDELVEGVGEAGAVVGVLVVAGEYGGAWVVVGGCVGGGEGEGAGFMLCIIATCACV